MMTDPSDQDTRLPGWWMTVRSAGAHLFCVCALSGKTRKSLLQELTFLFIFDILSMIMLLF